MKTLQRRTTASRPTARALRPMLVRMATLASLASLAGTGATIGAELPPDLQARNLAATCAACHGTGGHARGDMPSLAGMPADRITGRLAEFISGKRASTVMQQIAKGYSPTQLQAIARHFEAQR